MVECIVITSDSEEEVKSEYSVLVFTPTKRSPSPDLGQSQQDLKKWVTDAKFIFKAFINMHFTVRT